MGEEPSENLISGRGSPKSFVGGCCVLVSYQRWVEGRALFWVMGGAAHQLPCSTPKFLWLTACGLEEALIFDWWDVGTRGSPRAVGQCDPEGLFGATLENCNTNADAELTVGGLLGGLGTLSFHVHVVWSVHIHPQTRVQSRWLESGWPFYQGIWNILSRTANSSLEIIAMCTQYLLSSYDMPGT